MTSPAINWMEPRKMSLREKIAQLVLVRVGSNMPPVRTVEAQACALPADSFPRLSVLSRA